MGDFSEVQVLEFMEFVNNYPSDFCIETHDDNKETRDPKLNHRFSDINIEELTKLNQQGSGIFFSVNPMIQGKRDQASVTKIVTWVCEIDDMSKEEQRKLVKQSPIKPSCIVESKNSLHLYFFASNGTKENRVKIGSLLQSFFHGDPKVCKDYGWLLRLPGFYHMKDSSDPFLVKLSYIDKNLQYTEQDMIDWFSKVVDTTIEIQPHTKIYNPNEHGLWGYLSTWNNIEMLKAISGKPIINWDIIIFKNNSNWTKQIVVNKKSTWCRIDKSGMIWSHDKWWPTRINWITWYKTLSKRQLLQYVKDNFLSKIPAEYIPQLEKWNYLTDKGKLIAVEFARYLKESETFEGIEGNLFKYFSDEWLWKHLNDNEVSQIIIREAKEFLEMDISKQDLESVLKFLKVHSEGRVIKEKLQQVNQYEISLSDCILDTTTRTTRPYTKEDYKISKLPYISTDIADYDQHKPTRWLQFLEEVFASYQDVPSVIDFWDEIIGHFLLPLTKRGKMFILQGGGWNWKGVFLWAIRNMLGEDNCSTIELNKLEDVDREKLLGKLLAIDSDTSDNVRLDIGPLRKIIDGEPIEARKRYGNPYDFRPYSRIIIAANVAPTIKNMDSNMSRRIIYVPFRSNFQHRADTELKTTLEKEALGIFIRALHGLKRLLQRWKFNIPKEILYETEQYLNKFKSVATQDTVDEFIKHLWLDQWEGLLCKSVVYNAYKIYCSQQWIRKILGKQQLTRMLWIKGFNDKDDSNCRWIWVNSSSLNMTFLDKVTTEKSYEDGW